MRHLSVQIKLALYFAILCLTTLFLMKDALSNGTLPDVKGPELKNLNVIMTYCDTKEKILAMAKKDYRMHRAMKGLVHNHFYKELVSVEMWMNPDNDQWAISFMFKGQDKACIVGGNKAELFTPGEEGPGI